MSMYMWQCVVCRKYLYSENVIMEHCRRLVQWVNGIEGKGINMNSPKVKIQVSGYMTMTQENLDRIMTHPDPHMSLVYSVHMGYTDTTELVFTTPDE